jgi:hypothetical protein
VALLAPPTRHHLVAAQRAYGVADGALHRRNGVAVNTEKRCIGIGIS